LKPLQTPEGIERWVHNYPADDSYDQEGGRMPPATQRWVRLISAEDLERRAARKKYIGAIRHLRVLRRSTVGRILSLEAEGTKGSMSLEGEKAVTDFLSPGSLRSTLFTI